MSGFMNSSNGEAAGSNDRSVRHVMINQLLGLEFQEQGYELDGQPLKNALVVGTVTEFRTQNNRATVEVADGTGSISATVWNVSDDEPLELKYGQYASVYLEVRSYQEKTRFTASRVIQPIPFSQVLFHETCALKEHLQNTGAAGAAGAANGTTGAAAATSAEYGNDMFGDNERLKEQVLSVLNEEDGRSLDFLTREFGLEKPKLSALLEELDNAGRTWNDGESWYLTTD